MPPLSTIFFQLGLVILIGGLIGAEREYHSKSAGFRTVILICLGSYIFSFISIHLPGNSPDRIAANVVTGIGFLGAGVIFRGDGKISGITTAATVWATAALGMGIAMGYYEIVGLTAVVILCILMVFPKLEELIDRINLNRNYKIVSEYHENLLASYEDKMKACGLRFKMVRQTRKGSSITGIWSVNGSEKAHERFVEVILHEEEVKEFEF